MPKVRNCRWKEYDVSVDIRLEVRREVRRWKLARSFTPTTLQNACEFLKQQGYVILDRVFRGKELQQIVTDCDRLMARERELHFDPGDGPESPDDAEMEAYLARTYKVRRGRAGSSHEENPSHPRPEPQYSLAGAGGRR